jgi:hypothetical protein
MSDESWLHLIDLYDKAQGKLSSAKTEEEKRLAKAKLDRLGERLDREWRPDR